MDKADIALEILRLVAGKTEPQYGAGADAIAANFTAVFKQIYDDLEKGNIR
jgi:hypothetical protein